jgi:hypothetical protein
MSRQGAAPAIGVGSVSNVNGKLRYTTTAMNHTAMTLMVSYGKPGNWTGRTWHRIPMRSLGDKIVAEIPVYDPKVPFYAIAQLSSRSFGERGNDPIFVEPDKLGFTGATASYPHEIFDGTLEDELYLSTYSYYDKSIAFGQPGPEGLKSATIPLYWDGMVRMKNIEPRFWKGATEVTMWLKGDGKVQVAPVSVYFAYESQNSLDRDQQNFTAVPLVKAGEIFSASWKQYRVPLKGIANLAAVDSLFFDTGFKPLQVAGVSWR